MTREEHIELCKKRALIVLGRGDVHAAIAMFMAEMNSNPSTQINSMLAAIALKAVQHEDEAAARRFIEDIK